MQKRKLHLIRLLICFILVFTVVNITACHISFTEPEKEEIEDTKSPAAIQPERKLIEASSPNTVHLRKYRRILNDEEEGGKNITLLTYVPEEWKEITEEELNEYFDQVYQILVDEGISDDMDEMDAYHIIEQWLCENTSYDYTYEHTSFLDIMKYGTATCNGYSEMLCIMCEICGIKCYKVHGYVHYENEDDSYHSWNYINLDGDWYWVDVTFTDGGRTETHLNKNLPEDKTPKYFFEFPAADEPIE